jgi:hypothetical protein
MYIGALAIKYVGCDPMTGSYTKSKKTGEVPETEAEIGWVKLAQDAYRKISRMRNEEEGEQEYEFDISIASKHPAVGFDYARYPSKVGARYRQIPELWEKVKEMAAPFLDGEKLAESLCKDATELEIKAFLSGGNGAAAAASAKDATGDMDNMDDLS